MKEINFLIILAAFVVMNISAQNPLYKDGIINQFCEAYAEGMIKSELQSEILFFDQYQCINYATGNIFGENSNDAAAIFEETISGDGYRFGIVFRGRENSKLYPEAFTFDLYSSLESGTSGGSYFLIEEGNPLTLVNSTGSRMGQIFTYEYDYNYDRGRLELVKEIWEKYDKLSPKQGEQKVTTYEYWERPSLKTCLGEQFISDSQLKSITQIRDTYQNCLDTGEYMLGCAENYYNEIDKLLNKEYQSLRKMLNSEQKDELKSKQIAWLKKRDARFDMIGSEIMESGMGGNDAQMMIWDEKAEYVFDRVIELMESQTKLSN